MLKSNKDVLFAGIMFLIIGIVVLIINTWRWW